MSQLALQRGNAVTSDGIGWMGWDLGPGISDNDTVDGRNPAPVDVVNIP